MELTKEEFNKRIDNTMKMLIQYVRGAIDYAVEGTEDQFPVMGSTLVKAGVLSWKQLDKLEEDGHIKSITVEVPSVLKPGMVVKEKAYYTERRVPELVKNSVEATDKVKLDGMN